MRTSSLRQREFNFEGGGATVDTVSAPPTEQTSGATSTVQAIPSDTLYALTARRAGRLNARSIPQTEIDDWQRERQMLLDRKFSGHFSKEDKIRLTYVQWSLDRIDDALYGEELDRLESWIAEYERFGERIETLFDDLSKYKAKRK
jgi:hypothetical protein